MKRKEQGKGFLLRAVALMTLLLATFMLLFAGCGRGGENAGNLDSAMADAGGWEDGLFLKEFIPLSLEKAEEDKSEGTPQPFRYYDAYGSLLYLMVEYGMGSEKHLYVFDADTGKTEELPFSLEIEGKANSYVRMMDVLPDGNLSLRMIDCADNRTFLVKTDLTGAVLSMEDPFPNQDGYPWSADIFSVNRWKAFDFVDGSTMVCESEESSGKEKCYWFHAETGSRKKFGEVKGSLLSICKDGEEAFYCVVSGVLCRWDLKDNSFEKLLNLYDNGINAYAMGNNLLLNKAGEIVYCDIEGDMSGMYVFSREKYEKENSISLVQLQGYGMEFVSNQAAKYSRMHSDCQIEKKAENAELRQDFRDRVFLELAAGDGPELMWVSREDMRVLNDKGLLMELSDLIPEETREQIFSGVLLAGTLDGKLVGITPEVSFQTMVTIDEVWPEDHWTTADFLGLAEERENLEWPVILREGRVSFELLLYRFFLQDCSGVIDWEQGVCHFDSDEFRQALEFCKKYGKRDGEERTAGERLAMLRDGESLGVMGILEEGISDFSALMRMYGEDCHVVGYPTAFGGSGNFVSSEGYLVVNANAANLEEIKDFIAFLLDYDNQFTVNFSSVRRDVTRDSVTMVDGRLAQKKSNDAEIPTIQWIESKPGGSSYVEEYLKMAESCVPEPYRPEAVDRILGEELQSYFNGERSVDEVVRVIQSRVQLYLEENGCIIIH